MREFLLRNTSKALIRLHCATLYINSIPPSHSKSLSPSSLQFSLGSLYNYHLVTTTKPQYLINFGRKTMQKIIVSLDLHDDRCKQKAMKSVSGISGVDSVSMDMKDKKLTVIGDVDATLIVRKLRRHCHTTIVSVGPAKEPEKKKEEPKKEEPKKVEPKKILNDPAADLVNAYKAYNPHMTTHYYVQSAEEDPNACVIC